MTPQSQRARRWVSGLIALCVAGLITWFALDPTESLLMVPPFGAWNDEFLHVCAFALLAATVTAQGPAPVALAAVATFAALIEGAQALIPAREASLSDFAASAAGVALGWFAVAALRAAMTMFCSRGRA